MIYLKKFYIELKPRYLPCRASNKEGPCQFGRAGGGRDLSSLTKIEIDYLKAFILTKYNIYEMNNRLVQLIAIFNHLRY